MSHALLCLLALFISLNSPAMERNADIGRSSLAADSEPKLFRGMPGNGTQKAILGEQGIAVPRGTALDEASLTQHVLGEDVNAGVTSWTTDRAVAARFSGPAECQTAFPFTTVFGIDPANIIR